MRGQLHPSDAVKGCAHAQSVRAASMELKQQSLCMCAGRPSSTRSSRPAGGMARPGPRSTTTASSLVKQPLQGTRPTAGRCTPTLNSICQHLQVAWSRPGQHNTLLRPQCDLVQLAERVREASGAVAARALAELLEREWQQLKAMRQRYASAPIEVTPARATVTFNCSMLLPGLSNKTCCFRATSYLH